MNQVSVTCQQNGAYILMTSVKLNRDQLHIKATDVVEFLG
jgi:hypothetical protein